MIAIWKPYYKPPKDRCELCGKSLWGIERYKVRLYLRNKPFDRVIFKEIVVCSECLKKILYDSKLRKRFRIRYRKMRILNLW